MTGCTGQVSVQNGTELGYSFSCKSAEDVMTQLAVPAPLRPGIVSLFGSKLAVKNGTTLP